MADLAEVRVKGSIAGLPAECVVPFTAESLGRQPDGSVAVALRADVDNARIEMDGEVVWVSSSRS